MCVDALKEMRGAEISQDGLEKDLTEEEFDKAFAEFDHDGSG